MRPWYIFIIYGLLWFCDTVEIAICTMSRLPKFHKEKLLRETSLLFERREVMLCRIWLALKMSFSRGVHTFLYGSPLIKSIEHVCLKSDVHVVKGRSKEGSISSFFTNMQKFSVQEGWFCLIKISMSGIFKLKNHFRAPWKVHQFN